MSSPVVHVVYAPDPTDPLGCGQNAHEVELMAWSDQCLLILQPDGCWIAYANHAVISVEGQDLTPDIAAAMLGRPRV